VNRASVAGAVAASFVASLVASLVVLFGVASASPAAAAPAPAPAPDGTGVRLRPAAADDRRIVGILEVRVDGVPDEVKESFQRRLDEQLDTKHYWLASRARMKQMMMRSTTWTEGCLIGPCIKEVRIHTGADLVLLASLTGAGTTFGYVVTLVRTDTGRVLQQHSERCDVCTVNEALDKATLATVALLNNVPARLPDEAAERTQTLDLAVGQVKQQLAAHERHAVQLGIALTAVGLAALVGGIVLYQLDNHADYAVTTAASGGALAAGGLVVLTF
jgi:hypothetical protein